MMKRPNPRAGLSDVSDSNDEKPENLLIYQDNSASIAMDVLGEVLRDPILLNARMVGVIDGTPDEIMVPQVWNYAMTQLGTSSITLVFVSTDRGKSDRRLPAVNLLQRIQYDRDSKLLNYPGNIGRDVGSLLRDSAPRIAELIAAKDVERFYVSRGSTTTVNIDVTAGGQSLRDAYNIPIIGQPTTIEYGLDDNKGTKV